MKAAGLNAIETYIPWNYHEKFYQDYNFEGDADLPKFLSLANSVGLVVILRVGPYSCGEWVKVA